MTLATSRYKYGNFASAQNLHDHWPHTFDSSLTGTPNWEMKYKGTTMKFDDLAQIEQIRRKLENIQTLLNNAKVAKFFRMSDGTNNPQTNELHWKSVEMVAIEPLKETYSKVLSLEALKLLEQASRLGVDTEEERNTIAEFLGSLTQQKGTAT